MTSDLSLRAREWRHRLHECPEPGFEEHRTSAFVARVLDDLGLQVSRGIGGTGVVASLRLGDGPGSIGLRADMDGLPLQERGARRYRSRNDGVMHACGHDGHISMVLGAAAALVEEGGVVEKGGVVGKGGVVERGGGGGIVRFIFQPAEEHGLGARAMLADGLLDRFPIDAIYGLHNLPGVPAGQLQTRPGGIMASEDNFEIRITGRGGHAARPQMVVDPIVAGAQVVLALQTIVARNVDPAHSAVVSCTEFVTDGARNAIPGEVIIRGDTRSFEPAVRALLEDRIRVLSERVCAAHGAACSVSYTKEFEPTVNDPACTAAAVRAATAVVGAERTDPDCRPVMASEDFGAFTEAIPGCFSFIGNGTEPGHGGDPLHSRDFDFNDDILDVGIRFYVELVRSQLNRGAAG